MRRDGMTGVAWNPAEGPQRDPVFDSQGVWLLARFNDMATIDLGGTRFLTREPAEPPEEAIFNIADPDHVYLRREESLERTSPCLALSDGTYLYLTRGNPFDDSGGPYCPRL
ncbi:MAG TPA: hypothetical protein VF250_04445 [Conexibacter sp.]